MERILRLEETTFKKSKDDWDTFEGYIIVTDKQSIKIGVSNSQSCCENWGYVASVDDLDPFVGAKLNSIAVVDTALNAKTMKSQEDLDSGDIAYVNLDTDRGILQFALYNAHNGYYGHDATIISEQVTQNWSL